MAGKRQRTGLSSVASVVIAVAIVTAVALWLHSGSIEVECTDTSVKVTSPYWRSLEINYSEIATVTYRKDFDVGTRVFGIGSARLNVGTFRNEELDSYTLYAYAGAKDFIVLTANGKTAVLGMNSAEDAQAVYDRVLGLTG